MSGRWAWGVLVVAGAPLVLSGCSLLPGQPDPSWDPGVNAAIHRSVETATVDGLGSGRVDDALDRRPGTGRPCYSEPRGLGSTGDGRSCWMKDASARWWTEPYEPASGGRGATWLCEAAVNLLVQAGVEQSEVVREQGSIEECAAKATTTTGNSRWDDQTLVAFGPDREDPGLTWYATAYVGHSVKGFPQETQAKDGVTLSVARVDTRYVTQDDYAHVMGWRLPRYKPVPAFPDETWDRTPVSQ